MLALELLMTVRLSQLLGGDDCSPSLFGELFCGWLHQASLDCSNRMWIDLSKTAENRPLSFGLRTRLR